MLVPIRCFTCGYPIAKFWDEYKRRVESGEAPGEVLDNLGIKRYCCRRMFLSTFEYADEFLMYYKPSEEKEKEEKIEEVEERKAKTRKRREF